MSDFQSFCALVFAVVLLAVLTRQKRCKHCGKEPTDKIDSGLAFKK